MQAANPQQHASQPSLRSRREWLSRLAIVALLAALASCQNDPEFYAPPVQRGAFENFRPYRVSRVVQMSDVDAESHFVSDIQGLNGSWRWTGRRPTVKLAMRSNEDIHYEIDFTIPDITFSDTGPVTVSFYVNDRLLDRVTYDQAGSHQLDLPVPSDWIVPGEEATAAAEVDKLWTSPDDGAQLGLILTSIGLTQAPPGTQVAPETQAPGEPATQQP